MNPVPLLSLLLLVTASAPALAAQERWFVSQDDIRAALAEIGTAPHERLAPAVIAFYQARDHQGAWQTHRLGRVEPDRAAAHPATRLLLTLRAAGTHGLHPEAYLTPALEDAYRSTRRGRSTAREAARLDVLLTRAYHRYASHQRAGRLGPGSLYPDWDAAPQDDDVLQLLDEALRQDRVGALLASLPPPHAGYARLRAALARYRALAARGGWPSIPDGPTLRPGDRDPRVPVLRGRLDVTGELADAAEAPPSEAIGVPLDAILFDEALERAVRAYQERHALAVDGAVGPQTRAALNVPATERVRQLEFNLERWRWLPRDLGPRHIRIDVPTFDLVLIQDDAPTFEGRTIVGTRSNPSPVFSGTVTHVVLSPIWYVPRSIATAEILPRLRQDPSYLARNDMTLLQGGRRVDPYSIDWAEVSARSFPFQVQQAPGPRNRLGEAKIMFDNRFGIRLHGTPNPALFDRADRTLSYGCIRVERPLALAAALLDDESAWTPERIETAARASRETSVRLSRPVPIHVVYFTASADADGRVRFPADVYRRDPVLAAALDALRPSGAPTAHAS